MTSPPRGKWLNCRNLTPQTTFLCLSLALLLNGCQKAAPKTVPSKPPEVIFSLPVEQVVTDSEEFIGRTAAVETVDVRARVSGYLEKVHFKDGVDVKAGDLLFEIDSRSFKAEADRAAATVAQSKARVERVTKQYERAVQLRASKTITQEEFEAILFDKADATAAVEGALASQKLADLNLSYTRIVAPITGRLSRRLVDVGNLIQADVTILANIVSMNPIHAYFDVDERTVLRLRRMVQEGKIQSARNSQVTCRIALADEKDFNLTGVINFVDNQIEASSGTLRVRVVIDNAKQLLSPGFFVRVQVPIGVPHKAILVQEESLGTDQGQRFVYVINDKDEVNYQRVSVGALVGGKRVIDEGVKPTDRVIVTGLQRVRPGIKVTPKPYEVTSTATNGVTPKPPAGKLASTGKEH